MAEGHPERVCAQGSGYCVAAECLTREDVSLVAQVAVTAMRFRGK